MIGSEIMKITSSGRTKRRYQKHKRTRRRTRTRKNEKE